jgi:hypothetical protein
MDYVGCNIETVLNLVIVATQTAEYRVAAFGCLLLSVRMGCAILGRL